MAPRPTAPTLQTRLRPYLRAFLATVPVLAVTVYLYLESRGTERLLLEAETARQTDNASLQIQAFVGTRVEALRNVANFTLSRPPDGDHGEFARYVARLLADNPGFTGIVWFDTARRVEQLAPANFPGATLAPDNPLLSPVIARVYSTRQPAATDSYPLASGHRGVTIALPIERDNQRVGCVAGEIDLTRGLGGLYGSETLDYWTLDLWDHAGNYAFQSAPAASPSVASARQAGFHHVSVADRAWKFRVNPTPLLINTYRTVRAATHPGHRPAGGSGAGGREPVARASASSGWRRPCWKANAWPRTWRRPGGTSASWSTGSTPSSGKATRPCTGSPLSTSSPGSCSGWTRRAGSPSRASGSNTFTRTTAGGRRKTRGRR